MHRIPRPTPLLLGALVLLTVGAAHAQAPALPIERDPLVQNRDTTVNPGDDFFQYACGGWIAKHPIPASERGWGIGNVVREETYAQLRSICEDAARAHAAAGTSEQKVGDFWAAGMDSVAIEKAGARPLAPYLDEIAAIKDRAGLLAAIAHFQTIGIGPLYSMYVGQDERRSDMYRVHLVQGGLGLPDRDYYFGADSSTRHVRAEYRTHLVKMFRLLGEPAAQASRSRDDVMHIETALAARSRTIEELRDPWANYHKLSLDELAASGRAIDWKRQITGMGLSPVDSVIVGQPEFYAAADSLVGAADLRAWKSYLRWGVVNTLANRISRPFDLEDFHFFGTVLSGTKAQRPRWKRVLDAEEGGIGELMGEVWVKRFCSPATKARYEKLTQDVFDVYRDRIQSLAWMSADTKTKALAKLGKVARKVAYPDQWRDYSALQLDRSSWAADQVAINAWWYRHAADKLGKPIDRTEWDMTPQTYNAYYDEYKVEIVLPAVAFALPGIPDSLVDDAILYGYAAGSTIGHEITHGFDDEGRQFDANGNLNPWWTPSDSVEFARRTQKLVDQFDAYEVAGKHVRGRATLGENLADLGGVRLGYEAFKKSAQWKRGEKLNGLTPDQRYFLGYALSWLGQRRPESLATQIMTDTHAPQALRVNGPVANIREFYEAFGVKPGQKMYRDDSVRVEVW